MQVLYTAIAVVFAVDIHQMHRRTRSAVMDLGAGQIEIEALIDQLQRTEVVRIQVEAPFGLLIAW